MRAQLFGIDVDVLRLREAAERIRGWCESPLDHCHVVVTPNVQHVLLFQRNEDFKQAYACADLVVADGWPLITASRFLASHALPERVAGSDLAPAVLEASQNSENGRPLRVFLLGGRPGVPEKAARNICRKWTRVEVVGTDSPAFGFEQDEAEQSRMVQKVNAASPDFVIVGLGSPKQEVFLSNWQSELRAKVAIAAGATIDFLAGEQKRAPQWIRRLRLEWFHRACSDPMRLGPRYIWGAIGLAGLLSAEIGRKLCAQPEVSLERESNECARLGIE